MVGYNGGGAGDTDWLFDSPEPNYDERPAELDLEPRTMKRAFTYERQYLEDKGLGPIHEVSLAELRDKLIDWVKDIDTAITDLESHPGEWTRLTAFAFYRAVKREVRS